MHPALDLALGAAGRQAPRRGGDTGGTCRAAGGGPGGRPAGGGVGLGNGTPQFCGGSSVATGRARDGGTEIVVASRPRRPAIYRPWADGYPARAGRRAISLIFSLPPIGSMVLSIPAGWGHKRFFRSDSAHRTAMGGIFA